MSDEKTCGGIRYGENLIGVDLPEPVAVVMSDEGLKRFRHPAGAPV